MSTNFEVGNSYSFNTLAPAALGASFTNAKVIGIVGYDIATTFTNVDLKQRTIFPLLPAGTVNSPKNYTFILFLTQSGLKVVLALEWIDQNTIELVDSITLTMVISGVTSSDVSKITSAISLLGYTGFTVTTK